MSEAEFIATSATLAVDAAPGLQQISSQIEYASGSAPAWFKVDDCGHLPKRVLMGSGLVAYFFEGRDGRYHLYRVNTGLVAEHNRASLLAVQRLVADLGGRLDGFWVDPDGRALTVAPSLPSEHLATLASDKKPLPSFSALQNMPKPVPIVSERGRDELSAKARNPLTATETLDSLLLDRRLAPELVTNPSLSLTQAETLLAQLLKQGPWDLVHRLAEHPALRESQPSSLLRVPFASFAQRSGWHAQMMEPGLPMSVRTRACERLLGWGCEFSLDTVNLAPWLPLETPADVVADLLDLAIDRGKSDAGQRLDGQAADDEVACWSLPPLRPSQFQWLMALWRHPKLSIEQRACVGENLLKLNLSQAATSSLA